MSGARTGEVVQNSDCPHCRQGPETYRYLRKKFVFDVDLAREITADGREPVEIDDDSLAACLVDTRIYPQHLPHVDVQYPGIIAHVFFPLPDGTIERGHVLIDGNHRAARCRELGRPFFAYLLNEDESRHILLRRPRGTGSRTKTPQSAPESVLA